MVNKILIILFLLAAAPHLTGEGLVFADVPLSQQADPCPPECVTDSMEIVTWYPSPYNEYEELRLYPTQRDVNYCDNDKIGLMYYDHGGTPSFPDNDKMMVCKGTLLGWQEVGGEGFWKFADSSTSDIYYTKSGNVGIGTDTPEARVHIVKGISGGVAGNTITIPYTGNRYDYAVPYNAVSLTIEVFGAQGGAGGSAGGGYGGSVSGNISVQPGDIMSVFVGGSGGDGTAGWNGGGVGGTANGGPVSGGGGGGASDVRKNGFTLADRIIIAGGGGGGGSYYCGGGSPGPGGTGGGSSGSAGIDGQNAGTGGIGGGGGTQITFGGSGSLGGNPGEEGNGGAGASGGGSYPSGGGGGGGYYGGGGGGRGDNCNSGGGGGGGGSGYIISTANSISFQDGVRSGNGLVKITPILSEDVALYVEGILSVDGSKNFEIPHPSKPGMKLVHSSLEGPEAGVYYRGQARLDNGQAIITLPDYFEALTMSEGRSVLLTPVSGWAPLYVDDGIQDGRFMVKSADNAKTEQKFFWEVKAVRKDIPPLVVEKEDKNGK